MLIANPIYDVVFRFMMEDVNVAKYLISHILDREIVELSTSPTEIAFKLKRSSGTPLTVYRMDYAATLKNKDGKQYKVIIEIQKARVIDEVLRFRRYLAKQYNDSVVSEGDKETALPIISIYFLGHVLSSIKQPLIHVKRHYYDLSRGDCIDDREDFIEQLTHDSYIIQIPYLPREKKTTLEKILTVFDQRYIIDNEHLLDIPDKDIPDFLYALTRRLQQAQAEEELEEIMYIEDEYFSLEGRLEVSEKMLEEKERVLMERNKDIEARDKDIEEKDREIERLKRLLKDQP